MAASISEEVVRVSLDNKDFKVNAADTEKGISRLKTVFASMFDSKNPQDALAGVTSSAKAVDLSTINNSIEDVNSHFSFMGIMALNVFNRISNSVIDLGLKITRALTGGLSSGFAEYELKMNSVQTILANTKKQGTTMDDVTAALAKLNTYADKTVYSFSDMTKNIGRFTSAGVSLDDSVAAIKGISNLAAGMGVANEEAARATFQISQALASGKVKLQDWMSIENANLSGPLFTDVLKQVAKDMNGTDVDAMIKKYGTIRDSLTSEGWLTTDVLKTALNNMTVEGATAYANKMVEQGKYTKKQADAMIENAQMMEDAATKIKTFHQLIDTTTELIGTGWATTWEIIFGDFLTARDLWTTVGNALSGWIDAQHQARNNMLQTWSDLGGRADLLRGLSNLWEGLSKPIQAVNDVIKEFLPSSEAVGTHLAGATKRFADFTEKLVPSEDTLKKISDTTRKFITLLIDLKNNFKETLASIDLTGLYNIRDALLGVYNGAGGVTGVIDTIISAVRSLTDGIDGQDVKVIAIALAIAFFIKKMKDAKSEVNAIKGVFDTLKKAVLSPFEALENIGTGVKKLGTGVEYMGMAAIMGGIYLIAKAVVQIAALDPKSAMGAVAALGAIMAEVGAFLIVIGKFASIDKGGSMAVIVGALALLVKVAASAISTLGGMDAGAADQGMSALTSIFTTLGILLIVISKMPIDGKVSGVLLGLTVLIPAIAFSVKLLSEIPLPQLQTSIGALAVIFAALSAFILLVRDSKLASIGPQMVAMGVGLVLIASAVRILAVLPLKSLVAGTGAVIAIIGTIMLLAKYTKDAKLAGLAAGIFIMANAIVLIAGAIVLIGMLPLRKIAAALVAVETIIISFGVFAKVMKDMNLTKIAGTMLALSLSVQMIALAIAGLAMVPTAGLIGGTTAIVAIILTLGTFMTMVGKADGKFLTASVALVSAAGSIMIMAGAVSMLSLIPTDKLVVSLAVLTVLSGVMLFMSAVMTGNLAGAASFAIMSTGLISMATALILLSQVKMADIAQGLLGLGIAFGVILVFGYLAQGAALGFLAIAAAFLAIGVAAAGIGLLLGAIVLFGSVVTTLSPMISGILQALKDNVGGFIDLIATTFTEFITMLAENLPTWAGQIGNMLVDLFLVAIGILTEQIGPIIDSLLLFIQTALLGLAQGIWDHGDMIFFALVAVVLAIIGTLGKVLITLGKAMFDALVPMFVGFVNMIWKFVSDGFKAIIKGIGSFLGGVVGGAKNIASGILGAIGGIAVDLFNKGKDLMVRLKDGILNKLSTIGSAASDIKNKIIDTIKGIDLWQIGRDIVDGLKNGIKSKISSLGGTVSDLGGSIVNGVKGFFNINSPSRVMAKIAESIPEGMGVGIERSTRMAVKSAITMGSSILDGVKSQAQLINGALDASLVTDPTITPQLDLSNIEGIEELQNGSKTIRLTGAIGSASAPVTFGDININVNGTGSSNADDLINKIRTEVKAIFVNEVRTVKA